MGSSFGGGGIDTSGGQAFSTDDEVPSIGLYSTDASSAGGGDGYQFAPGFGFGQNVSGMGGQTGSGDWSSWQAGTGGTGGLSSKVASALQKLGDAMKPPGDQSANKPYNPPDPIPHPQGAQSTFARGGGAADLLQLAQLLRGGAPLGPASATIRGLLG